MIKLRTSRQCSAYLSLLPTREKDDSKRFLYNTASVHEPRTLFWRMRRRLGSGSRLDRDANVHLTCP